MKIIRGYAQNTGPLAATIGNFDGVHLGHQAMLTRLVEEAKKRQLPVAVIVFEPQPAEYFKGKDAPARLSSLREKIAEFRNHGVDYVVCLTFDKSLAVLEAGEFARKILFEKLNVRYLLVGQDFRFGRNRLGDIPLLASEAQRIDAKVECFPDFTETGMRVSSTRIREALACGDFTAAKRLLGRSYRLCGRVIHGAHRGREWGIPTANIALQRRHSVLKGVYHVRAYRADGECLPAVANIGTRPTVDGSRAYLEVHILDFDSSLYGEMLQVEFLHKLRDEIKFSSVEALIAQIRCDIHSCYEFFSMSPQNL